MTAPAIFPFNGATAAYATASTTIYGSILAGAVVLNTSGLGSTTEALSASVVGTAGVFSKLYTNVPLNTRTSTTTLTFRLNNADAAITVSYTSGQTGVKTDTSNSVTVAVGDTVDISLTTGINTGSFSLGSCAITFTPSSGTTCAVGAFNSAGVTLAGTGPITDFIAFVGILSSSSLVEAEAQINVPVTGTAKYMQMYVSTNGRSTSTVCTFRKNAGNGNQTFTYTSGQTGAKTDTSNTDSISAGDLVCCSPVLGTGTGNFTINATSFWFDSDTDGQAFTGNAFTTGQAFVAAQTVNFSIGGRLGANFTETNTQGEMGTAGTADKLWCYVKTNASTTAATLKFRNGAANGNQVASITALTTGPFQDTTHTDAFATTDLVNDQITNITTGNVTITAVSMRITTTVIPVVISGGTLPMMGVG